MCKATQAIAVLVVLSHTLPTAAQRRLEVLHSAITETPEGQDLEVTANVRRFGEVRELNVRYRVKGAPAFKGLPLRRTQGDFFEAKIPAADVRGAALEYYLELIDREGTARAAFASQAEPQLVRILPAERVGRRTALEEEMAVFAEEQVFSAARQRQRIEESPSAITVITAEDLRNYGSTSVAEALRTVPGIDYMQIGGSDPNLSARGFNRELSNRILTLIDGRSAYVDVFGMTFWEVLPISIWDIDRIEVIRGPGSTLYGANAFGGVVNIYTKSPEQARGMHFYTQGGDHGFNSTLLAAGKANKWTGYRISVTHDQISSFDRVTVDEKIGVRGNALIQFDLPDNAKLTLRGGVVRQFFGPTMTLNGPFSTEATLGTAQLNLDYKNLRFQVWYNGIKADLDRRFPIPGLVTARFGNIPIAPIPNARPDTLDVETTYTALPSELLRMTFGLNYRFNQFDIPTLLEPQNREHLFGVFGQFEIRPHRTLSINLGARFDSLSFATDVCPALQITECLAGEVPKKAPESLLNFSPRGALVWGMHQNHFLRLSGGLAFRNPAFVENLIRYRVADAGVRPDGVRRPGIIFAGNETLGAEQLRSAEIGYGAKLFGNRLRLNLDLFYLVGVDLILFQGGSLLAALSQSDRQDVVGSTYRNLVNARNYGFEFSVRATVSSWLKAFANYSWQRVELTNKAELQALLPSLGLRNLEDLTTVDSESPMHKLNFGVNISHPGTGLFINLYGHFVGGTRRRNTFTMIPDTLVAPNVTLGQATMGTIRALEEIEAYFLLNANLGYRLFDGQLEFGVTGFNLLGGYDVLAGDGFDPMTGALQNRRHIEYPRLSMQGQIFGGEAIGARVFAFIRGHFR